jgi:hypothetical protein
MGAEAFHDRFGDVPPTEGWGKAAFDIWMGVDVAGEEDGIGGAVISKPSSVSSGSDWFFVTVATLITLACVVIAFYFRAP